MPVVKSKAPPVDLKRREALTKATAAVGLAGVAMTEAFEWNASPSLPHKNYKLLRDHYCHQVDRTMWHTQTFKSSQPILIQT